MSEVPQLKIDNLTVGYPQKTSGHWNIVQAGLNAEIHSGKMIGLLGGNGVGKSTLMRSLLKMQPIVKGQVFLNGKDLAMIAHQALAKEISVVLTDKISTPFLTVEELIFSGRSPHTNWWGRHSQADVDIVDRIVEKLGIGHILQQPITDLSDGQKQLALIGRALAQDTPIIFLDEPAAHLDVPNKIVIFSILRELAATGKTILISSHELDLSLQFCDEILLLHKEKSPAFGMPEEMVLSGEFAAFFEKKEVTFNAESGRFEAPLVLNKAIQLVNFSALEQKWLQQALAKIGVGINPNVQEKVEKIGNDYVFNKVIYRRLSDLVNAVGKGLI
ncbi:ABC transporter ATP-binding protein [Persicobacter sp. CCB-QB2]|uniref:ABC transporter ATP-binding protein n=1 Tax=Persicobacter sp. CCB-QB2 TaxID=1561025 RepID=UPI0006A97FA2|nr:ABC transporter ATP-binding protein [Persicobacter sp. CCB-QB2]